MPAKPMTAISAKSFRCERCHEIVIVFAVVSKFLSLKNFLSLKITSPVEDVGSRAFIDR